MKFLKCKLWMNAYDECEDGAKSILSFGSGSPYLAGELLHRGAAWKPGEKGAKRLTTQTLAPLLRKPVRNEAL